MRLNHTGHAACAAALVFAGASAETTSKETVTVSASKPTVQVLPDRVVYSLDKTIQTSTSSLSDVMRNLPSIDVDIQGNVSLRGDSNVTILIDGKESPLLAGNRGDALQQIPASLVERIEVVTNPSAEYRAEGSGGIINIVLKKNKEMASSGVVRANVGNNGRVNASASGNIKLGRVTLNGALGERRDTYKSAISSTRTDGINLRSSQQATNKGTSAGRYATLSANFQATPTDALEFGTSYNRWGGRSDAKEHNIAVASTSDTSRNGTAAWMREGVWTGIQYRHDFATKGEVFNLDVSRYTSWGRNTSDYTTTDNVLSQIDYWQSRRTSSRDAHTELKTDYTLPLAPKGKIKVGYGLQNDDSLSDNRGLWRDPTIPDWAVDAAFTNAFAIDRTIHSAYVSYDQKFGRFGVMGGLRLEQDFLSTDLRTTGEKHDTSSLGFYPSVHLSYGLTDTQELKLSYSRRMNRPGTYALNPARYSNDAFNVWAGNPYLKPEQVDSFETSYRYTGEKMDAVVTGFYRATYKGITNVYRYLSPTVLLTTMDNLARRMASGAEANFNTNLWTGVSLRTTGSFFYNEFNPGALGVGAKQSGLGWNVRGGIDWQIAPDDLLQFNANYSGKQKFAQGYREPSLAGDLGYKHKFEGGYSTVVSINNLFNSWGRNSVLDSPGVHQADHRNMMGRIYYLGLVYTFGGAKDTDRPAPEGEGGGGGGGQLGGGGPPV